MGIGVAVRDVEKATEIYGKVLRQEPLPPIEFETGNIKLKILFFQLGEAQLELI